MNTCLKDVNILKKLHEDFVKYVNTFFNCMNIYFNMRDQFLLSYMNIAIFFVILGTISLSCVNIFYEH